MAEWAQCLQVTVMWLILEATNPGDSCTENLPSTAEAYQICKCSLRSTFPIPRTTLMTIPSSLDLANNVVENKHFSGSGDGGGGEGVRKVYRVHMNTTLFGLN